MSWPARRRSGLTLGVVAVVVAFVAAAVVGSSAAASRLPMASASVAGGPQFVNDKDGTVFTFTVVNTGTVAIGGVQISRPTDKWRIVDCLQVPTGWSADRTDDRCRVRSQKDPADDL